MSDATDRLAAENAMLREALVRINRALGGSSVDVFALRQQVLDGLLIPASVEDWLAAHDAEVVKPWREALRRVYSQMAADTFPEIDEMLR